MTELNDDLKRRIWKHLHGELDEQADKELRVMARENEAIARAIHARHDLDSLITEAVRVEIPVATESQKTVSSGPLEKGADWGQLIPFPMWRRVAKIAAVFAIVLSGVYLTIPHGDLRWSSTQIALLDQTRSIDSSSKVSMLDRSSVKKICSDLRKVIGTAYENALGGEVRKWELGLVVTEHTEGAFEVRVNARAADDEDLTITEARRYRSVSDFKADLEGLSKATVLALQGDER